MKIRSFIAVDPSSEVTAKINNVLKDLEGQTRGVRWVHSDGLHLTLRFLGEIEKEVLDAIQEKISQLVTEESPISLQASGIGFFPNASRPRVVCVGLKGETEKLEAVQKKIRRAVADLPVHREKEREFSPHITLARIADFHRASGVARILEAAKSADFGDFEVKALILYKSRLTPQGSRYTKLQEFSFGRSLWKS